MGFYLQRFPRTQRRVTCISKAGRITLSAKEWRKLVEEVWFRAGGQCENTLPNGTRCHNRANDPHHILWRSRGGSDTWENVAASCRACHNFEHDGKQPFKLWKEGDYDA